MIRLGGKHIGRRNMKTLDKLIREADDCNENLNCNNCKHESNYEGCEIDWKAWEKDALDYLKKYRQTRKDLLDGMKRLEEKEMMFIHAMDDTENNHPLSWEELKSMKGKPVWVELNSEYGNFSHWGIIRNFLKIGREFEYMELLGYYDIVTFSVIKEDQGKKWQAYRKERKNETD